MEEYLLQGPPAYKRPRLGDSLQTNSPNFLDAQTSMVPFGFVATPDREADMSMAAMPMGGSLSLNPEHSADFNLALGRRQIPPLSRDNFVHKISQALLHNAGYEGNSNIPPDKWVAAARKIEGKVFKTVTTRAQYYRTLMEELHKIRMGYGFAALSSQYSPSSSTTSASGANGLPPVNMPLNYRPNSFGEPGDIELSLRAQSRAASNRCVSERHSRAVVPATQSHSQSGGIAHSATSGNLYSDDPVVGAGMRIPVTSSMGSARPQQFEPFNGRQPGPPRQLVHDQVPGSSIPLAFPVEPAQFMPGGEQVLSQNLLHSMNSLMSPSMGQFAPSASGSVGAQQAQRFGIAEEPGVMAECMMGYQQLQRMPSKDWHKSGIFIVRNRLIRKMAQILSTVPDLQGSTACMENRMHQCICIATSVENDVYRTANSVTEYYDLMAKRCHLIVKERTTGNPASLHVFNPSDIRRTYEALGIPYPPPPYPGSQSSGGNSAGNNPGGASTSGAGGPVMRLHDSGSESAAQPPPPPPGVMPGIMGAATGAAPLPYGFVPRGRAVQPGPITPQQQPTPLLGALPLSLETPDSLTPESVKQLAHAYKCLERENQENNDVILLCSVPYCRDAKNLLNHAAVCQIGGNQCCGPTKEIVNHWNHCLLDDCPSCQPMRQAERSLNAAAADARASSCRTYQHRFLPSATATSQMGGQMGVNSVFMRRHHGRGGMGSSYPSTATSGLLSNQSSQPPGGPARNEPRLSQRAASMWHSSYNDAAGGWRGASNPESAAAAGMDSLRRGNPQQRFWLHNRSPGAARHERRTPYGNNPWASPEVIFVENARPLGSAVQPHPARGAALFGAMPQVRNIDRLQPYGTPWRSLDYIFDIVVRPAHRPAQDSDEPVIIPPEEDDETPSEHSQIMAIVNVLKTHGGRLEQKYRCSRRSCSAAWPCLHRRLAASIQSLETPPPG